MENEIFHNVFGEEVAETPILAKREYGILNQYGDLVPNYCVGDYTDKNGFDTRNIELNGEYTTEMKLPKGTMLCRYGSEYGKYSTYVGATYEQLALPWDIRSIQYHEYEVIADGLEVELVVTKGLVGPQETFRSEGGAIQFLHKYSILEEVEERHTLRRINYDCEIGRKDPAILNASNERNNQ